MLKEIRELWNYQTDITSKEGDEKMFKSKVLFALFMGLIFTSTLFAGEYPVDKGSFALSGSLSFANYSGDLYEDYEGDAMTTITLTPSALYFVIPNFAIGGNFGLSYMSQGDESLTEFIIGPKIAYFIGKPDSKVYPFFGMGFNFVSISAGGDETDNITGTKLSLGGGAAVMVKTHWALTFEAVYNLDNLKQDDESASGNVFGVGIGIVGFVF